MKKLTTPVGLSLLSMCLLVGSGFPAAPVYAKTKSDVKHKVRVSSKKETSVSAEKDQISIKASELITKTPGLNRQVLELALVAHGNAKRIGKTRSNILTVVDYSLPSTKKRLWVIDINNNKVLFNEYVAHGVNSGGRYTTKFSNTPGSRASSYGVFLTAATYHGQHGYSLRLDGLEKNLNHNARNRAIVMHGGSYVSQTAINMIGRLGRSWGCFTLRKNISEPVINVVRNRTVIFAYYPNFKWLATSKFLNRKALVR